MKVLSKATINTESPSCAIGRLSILQLKIYHIRVDTERASISEEHRITVRSKLSVLLQQNGALFLLPWRIWGETEAYEGLQADVDVCCPNAQSDPQFPKPIQK